MGEDTALTQSSGNTTSEAPPTAAFWMSSTVLRTVAAESKKTGEAWTDATLYLVVGGVMASARVRSVVEGRADSGEVEQGLGRRSVERDGRAKTLLSSGERRRALGLVERDRARDKTVLAVSGRQRKEATYDKLGRSLPTVLTPLVI